MIATSEIRKEYKFYLEIDMILVENLNDKDMIDFLKIIFMNVDELHYMAFGPAGGNECMQMLFRKKENAQAVQDAWVSLCTSGDINDDGSDAREMAPIQEWDYDTMNRAFIYEDRLHLYKLQEIKPIGLKEDK